MDIRWACRTVAEISPASYIVGNFHPVEVLLHGSPDDVRHACRECEQQADGFDNFILALSLAGK